MSAIMSFLEHLPANCQLGLESRLGRLHEQEKTLPAKEIVKVTSSWVNNPFFGDLDRATTHYTLGFGRVYDVKAIPNLVGAALCSIAAIPALLVRTIWSVCCLAKVLLLSNQRKGVFDPFLENASSLLQATVMTIVSVALAAFKLATFSLKDPYNYLKGKCSDGLGKKVLLIIDVQKDFEPGGALEVPNGHQVVPAINAFLKKIKDDPNWRVVVSQDWHPFRHQSFAANNGFKPAIPEGGFKVGTLNGIKQTFWPAHCVQGSLGAKIDKDLELDTIDSSRRFTVKKGFSKPIDSYSAFQNNRNEKTEPVDGENLVKDDTIRDDTVLNERLEYWKTEEVVVVGLASDFCDKYSAEDAFKRKYKTTVIEEGCRGIIGNPSGSGICPAAFDEMRAKKIDVLKTVDEYFPPKSKP